MVRASRRGSAIVVAPARESFRAAAPAPAPAGGRKPRVAALVSDLSARHERLELPPMSRRRRQLALARRLDALREKDDGREVSCAESRPDRPGELLMISVSKRAVGDSIARARALGLRIESLRTPLAAVLGLLMECSVVGDDDSATVIVHLGDAVGSVGFVRQGGLLLSRGFAMPESAPRDPEGGTAVQPCSLSAAAHESLIAEIGRSLLYFNHELHGVPVGRMLISSDLAGLDALVPLCRERFRVPVELTMDAMGLDVTGFAKQLQPIDESADMWLGPIAAAVSALVGRPDIDLLPHAVVTEHARRRALRGTAAVFCGIAVAATCWNVSTLGDLRDATNRLEEGQGRIAELNDELYELRAERIERQAARERLTLLARATSPVSALGDVLSGLATSAEGGITLERVEMLPRRVTADAYDDPAAFGDAMDDPLDGDGSPARPVAVVVNGHAPSPRRLLRVEGRVEGTSVAEAERLFARFYARINELKRFEGVTLDPIELSGDEETGVSALRFVLRASI